MARRRIHRGKAAPAQLIAEAVYKAFTGTGSATNNHGRGENLPIPNRTESRMLVDEALYPARTNV